MSRNSLDPDDTAAEFTDVPQEPFRWHRLYPNLRAFFSRFLALAYQPRRFAPLVVDYCLLLQSTWSGRQPGPDLVYPMLSIRKRQSGRLARLILEHCRVVRQYGLRAAMPSSQGFEPSCVAVVDLDEVPQDIDGNGYSTQADLYGLMCLVILFDTVITVTLHVSYLGFDWIWVNFNWINNLVICLSVVFWGDGTLVLARRSDTSAPGCAVLLDQDFTVVLNGSQSVVEAIAESSFNLSHPNTVWPLRRDAEDNGQDLLYDLLETLCESADLILFALCWSLFWPSTALGIMAPMAAVSFVGRLSRRRSPPDHSTPLQEAWSVAGGVISRSFLPRLFILTYAQAVMGNSFFSFDWRREFLATVLSILFLAGYRSRDYPIRSGKFLDALGHPRVRKWQFDTLVAAATFQCLVLCRGIARPIRSIDVFAFLDMLVPDQRVVQEAWKERVADRIVHEPEADICFAPTIPTFGDERQQQLKELLDQAQLGYRKYRHFYG